MLSTEFIVILFNEKGRFCPCKKTLKIRPAQLSCLGGSVGRASAQYAECHGFESRLRQLIFSPEKESCLQVQLPSFALSL